MTRFLWLWILICSGFPLAAVAGATVSDTAAGGNRTVHVITVDDSIINPVVSEYIEEAINRAEGESAEALVIELDTPGGLLSSTRTIVKKIMNAKVPVIVYVAPSGARAGSAGVFITLAAHVAAMAPSTNIGAAHPVEFGENPKRERDSIKELVRAFKKEEEKGPAKKEAPQSGKTEKSEKAEADANPMADKILNDTVAWVSTIAKTRGRNVGWAVRAVKESISSGEDEALRLRAVDLIASDLSNLLQEIDGRKIDLSPGQTVTLRTAGAVVARQGFTLRQRILNVLINPNIAYILMILGFYGLLFEITHPGVWFPGVAGLVCLILAFYAFHTLPTNYAGLALILLAVGLFIAEAMVPSYGLLTVVGVVCMLLGSLFLVDSTAEFMQISLRLILPVVGATAGIFIFLVGLAVKAQRQTSPVGAEGLVGMSGMVKGGKVEVGAEWWDLLAEEPLADGDQVRITAVEGLRLRVRKV